MKEKLIKACKTACSFMAALIETIVSAAFAIVLYLVYVPFAFGRVMFDRKAIRDFFGDVLWAIDGIGERIMKRKDGR